MATGFQEVAHQGGAAWCDIRRLARVSRAKAQARLSPALQVVQRYSDAAHVSCKRQKSVPQASAAGYGVSEQALCRSPGLETEV
jgi:hypothetical protein